MVQDNKYDIAIIGSGPAGLAAAINAKIRNKNILVFGTKNLSTKLEKAPLIKNYLGFSDITGEELKNKFKEHVDKMGISIKYEKVNAVYAMGNYFSIISGQKTYNALKVIIATGIEFTKPMNGEEEYMGRGVGYCATCDAPLYKGKTAAVIGYAKEDEKDANFLSEIASKVYYIPMYKGEYDLAADIEVIQDKPIEIKGNMKAEKLVLKNTEITVDGIFILKENVPPSQLVPGLLMEDGHIKVNVNMETNIKGCYACGDCTGKPYQYMKSTGQGQVAALNAVSQLDSIQK